MRARSSDPSFIATTAQRLSVLLAAGVPPAAAWDYVEDRPVTATIRARISAGLAPPEAIVAATREHPREDGAAWSAIAAAWALAVESGAPLASTLADFADTQRDLVEAERDVAVALASPIATSRLLLVLPAVGVLFGYALGFDTPATLATTPIGWACSVVGVGLIVLGRLWNRRLIRRARPDDRAPGLTLDLLAVALAGGSSPATAVAAVMRVMTRFGLEERVDPSAESILELSRRAGVPASDLLRSEATERRRAARATARADAERLSVRLMLPLGVCVLPSFVLLGVVPLLLAIVGSTSIGL